MRSALFLILFLFLFFTPRAQAQLDSVTETERVTRRSLERDSHDESPLSDEADVYLTGDWGGRRTWLADRGIDLTSVLIYEYGANVAGGNDRGSARLFNGDLRVAGDTEKLGWWKNGSFALYYVYNSGQNLSDLTGDLQWSSNLEATPDFNRLYELWYQHLFFDKRLSLLVGLHDLNSEFYVTETAARFLNASFGIGYELSQTGQNGPSIFPTTSFAGRVRYESSSDFYAQAAIYDGVPGLRDRTDGTHIKISGDEGALVIAEVGTYGEESDENEDSERAASFGVGAWHYTTRQETFAGDEITNGGLYAISEVHFDERTSAFVRGGIARPQLNQAVANVSFGALRRGVFLASPRDLIGLAATTVFPSPDFRRSGEADAAAVRGPETAVELTYRFTLYRGFALQPDLQYCYNPGFGISAIDALAVLLRAEVAL